MVPFARELARAGLVVMTPEMTDLADYRITHQGVSVIRDATVYLRGRHDLVGRRAGRHPRLQLRGRPLDGRRGRARARGPRRLRRQRRRPPRSRTRAALPDPQQGRDAGGPRPDAGARLRAGGAAVRRGRSLRARARSRARCATPCARRCTRIARRHWRRRRASRRSGASSCGSSPTRASSRRWRRNWKRSSTSSAPSWRRCRRAGGWRRSTRPSISCTAPATP